VVLRYEEFGVTRTIPLGPRGATTAGEPTQLGVSSARVEAGELVVETSRIAARRFYGWLAPRSDGELEGTERYTTSADGAWLDLTLELFDSQAPGAPLIVTKRWRREPGASIAHYGCDVMSGGLRRVRRSRANRRARERGELAAADGRLPTVKRSPEAIDLLVSNCLL
jgi:hypothetical protein